MLNKEKGKENCNRSLNVASQEIDGRKANRYIAINPGIKIHHSKARVEPHYLVHPG